MLPTSSDRSQRRRPAGWSLIEILVATGLVLAMLGVGIPLALRAFERGELAATEENLASELLKARAEAQSSGRPVEVLIERDPGRIIQRYFAPGAGLGLDRGPDAKGATTPKRRAAADAPWRRESSIDPAVTVERAKASADDDEDASRTSSGGPTRVAVFMPDGSILFAASLILMHESGMRSQVSLDPYTGHPAIARVSDEAESDADETGDGDEDEAAPAQGTGPANDALRFERAP